MKKSCVAIWKYRMCVRLNDGINEKRKDNNQDELDKIDLWKNEAKGAYT